MKNHWSAFRNNVGLLAKYILAFSFVVTVSIRTAQAIEIYDTGVFLHSPSVGANSLGYLDGQFNDFDGSGISLGFTKSLDSFGYGTLQWQFANNTGNTLTNAWLFGFLDAEIDPDLNSSYNESGRLVSVNGSGSQDVAADTWEIDEPGFSFGDIYNHLFTGTLDNYNAITAGNENDLSMALGFYLGNLLAGENWVLTLSISPVDIGGLAQLDKDSGLEFFFNGTAVKDKFSSVSEPSTVLLMFFGLLSLYLDRRFFNQ